MKRLYKITLLIAMSVVTWKVCKIESHNKKIAMDINLNSISPSRLEQL